MMDVVMKPQAGHVCYARLGCFNPGNRMALKIGGPASPRELGTKFRFYKDRRSRGVDAELLLRAMRIGINQWDLGGKPLVVIIHGFMQHGGVPWVTNLKNALLDEVNANVVTVNWWKGAKFPNYGAAAANTAMVGAQLSLLLQDILKSSLLRASHVHLVGFSLGAHVAGFCGRHFRNITGHSLGRITGLDPAGPLFEGTNVSLSRADADFVDVIHTNAGPISELKFGIQDPLGHVDFYPNGGSKQPKCADETDHNRRTLA
ncbi:inactive pancreatic lipase-related protein 1-like isoform X2 [Dermacentor andersoni]|uniref:inactive pancreatic lipase-related protein 1-like isoform X2 n=1 Tax=Dermacentor andersoni TaxID=34620 RepID=UPI00241638E7|nr:inactive pancreatic lipase-related protein 1-like isoform X2 [Dermacentor andersoni]